MPSTFPMLTATTSAVCPRPSAGTSWRSWCRPASRARFACPRRLLRMVRRSCARPAGQGLAGIVARHRDRPYRSGRHDDWAAGTTASSSSATSRRALSSARSRACCSPSGKAARLFPVGIVAIEAAQLSAWALHRALEPIRSISRRSGSRGGMSSR